VLAITRQPLAYASMVARQLAEPFEVGHHGEQLPLGQPSSAALSQANYLYAAGAVRAYTGNSQHLTATLGPRVQQPYATILREYQKILSLPGPLFALILATGLAGLLLPRRRTGLGHRRHHLDPADRDTFLRPPVHHLRRPLGLHRRRARPPPVHPPRRATATRPRAIMVADHGVPWHVLTGLAPGPGVVAVAVAGGTSWAVALMLQAVLEVRP
jgi:hypothetical protein